MKDNNFNEFMNRLVDDSHKSKVNEQVAKCPECGDVLVQDDKGYFYCENCGWKEPEWHPSKSQIAKVKSEESIGLTI